MAERRQAGVAGTSGEKACRLGRGGWALVLGLYLVVFIVTTYPFVLHVGQALPGIPGDGPGYLWSFDSFWTQLRAGRNPFYSERVLVPLGANLAYSESLPLLSFFAYPFLSHLVLYGGLVILVSFMSAAVGMLLLVRALTSDDGAAAVAGLLYAFGPALLSLLWVSHFTMVAGAALLPFGILFLVQFMRSGRPGPLVALSLVLWVVAFTQVYMAAALVVMVVVMSVVLAPARVRGRHVAWGLVVGSANVLLAWAVVTLIFGDASEISGAGYGFTSQSVVNLVDLLVPSARNPVLGFLAPRLAFDGPHGEVDYFLGWGILALTIGGVVARRRDVEIIALAVAGIAVLIVACGSAIRWGERELLTHGATPFEWLARLPYFKLLDSPRRLVVGSMLAAATLAGVGLAALASRGRRRGLVLLGGVLLWALEYGQVGMSITAFPAPAIYRRLAAAPDSRTLLELGGGGVAYSGGGFGIDWTMPSSHRMFWQTIHRKPRIGGYVSRISSATHHWFMNAPVLGELFAISHAGGYTWPGTCYLPEVVSEFIRTFNLGYVIVPPHPRQTEYEQVIESILAGRIAKIETDGGYTLYTLVDDAAAVTPAAQGP